MGFLSWLTGHQTLAIDDPGRLTFAVDETVIDPAIFGLVSYADTTAPVGRVPKAAPSRCRP